MFQDAFIKLDTAEIEDVLRDLNPVLDGLPLEPGLVTALGYDLPFYPGFRFIEVADYESAPNRHYYTIYKPGDLTILNWTNEPIYLLNERAPISLNDETVADYIRFFFKFVSGRHGRFLIVESVDDVNWQEEPPPPARKAMGQIIQPLIKKQGDSASGYKIGASMVFKNSLFKADILVKPNGFITLTEEELVVEEMPVRDDIFGQ